MLNPKATQQHNVNDPRVVRIYQRIETRQQEMVDEAFRVVLQDYHGRAMLWETLSAAGLHRSMVADSVEATHRLIGRRDFGLELQAAILRVAEDGYELMEKEARERNRRDAADVQAKLDALTARKTSEDRDDPTD